MIVTHGQLRLYLGATPGVGKTHAMVEEGLRRADRGTDVVIGVLDIDSRPAWKGRVIPLERIATTDGVGGEPELDVGLILRRQPRVVLIDELGHRVSPDHARWESVDRILASGIDVISTFDIGDLASLHGTVTTITGVESTRFVPDSFLTRTRRSNWST